MNATSPGDFHGLGLPVCVALFIRFVMFGLHVKFLILRIISDSVLNRLVTEVVNVDCPGILFLSMLIIYTWSKKAMIIGGISQRRCLDWISIT